MKRKVTLASAALHDIASTIDYVATRHGIDAAIAVDDLIADGIRSLDRMPDRGRVVPELERRSLSGHREVIAGPYRIVYRVADREVLVVAVVDGRRDLDELLYERARR